MFGDKFSELFNRKESLILSAVYAKWYFFIMPIAIVTVYNIYMALEKKGIPDRFFAYVQLLLKDVERTSQVCAPHLVESLQRFINCL